MNTSTSMNISYVLTATNSNEMYADFIPSFIKAWKALFPNVKVKIIYVANEIPQKYADYTNELILFKPIDAIHTAFQAQCIRLLYPALLGETQKEKEECGVLITDMDMIPMNTSYYTKNIKDIPLNKFVSYRNVLQRYKELAICYNLATPVVWKDIFKIDNIECIVNKLKEWYKPINYLGIPGKSGWTTDQTRLFTIINEYQSKTRNVVYLNDGKNGYNRMNRNNQKVILNDINKHNIVRGVYSDYHMHRPYKVHHSYIDNVISCLSNH